MDQESLISSGLFSDNQLYQVLLSSIDYVASFSYDVILY